MELDELKNTWAALDERLKQNESLNTRIVKEMLETKSNKSLSKILRYETIGAFVVLAIAPFILFIYDDRFQIKDKTIGPLFLVSMFFLCLLSFVWQAFKIYNLMKIDFSAVVSDNIRIVNRYNIWIKREKLITWFSIPLLGGLCTYLYAQLSLNLFSWVFLTCVFILVTLFTYYQYKTLYDKNINSILKSLDELKELDE
ncbi:hypothetical protein CLV62_10224 [Dysgonomonas alginatilytica]|uniref:Uncharacterized protein n=1 Tax=Dysgonomonas alginatilytica TaxID=1605892 RepID=A0A2V3PUM9_9BACT|nr:hypothetical protein [Dysgonomonas alginatilytica]PXV67994.1 hypothetical protein CLV62_10224 [Dysgonomonas alginatilytica]